MGSTFGMYPFSASFNTFENLNRSDMMSGIRRRAVGNISLLMSGSHRTG